MYYIEIKKSATNIFFLFVLLNFSFLTSQNNQANLNKKNLVESFGFEEYVLAINNDSIHYYLYKKKSHTINNVILFIQGSDPSPQFSYSKSKNGYLKYNNFIKNDYKNIPDNYGYIVVEKTGFERLIDENNIKVPKIYHQKNSLQHRVNRINNVINSLYKKYQLTKIVVYGHSEGAPVAAKLATINTKITHLGFWAGNALPDFFDTILDIRKSYQMKEISIEESDSSINEVINYFSNIITKDSLNTDVDDFGYTNKRWFSYSEPPINNLLKLDIPIYVQVASKDENAPIESTYLIPLEFARLGKKNLNFNICSGCNHSFKIIGENNEIINKWEKIFKGFMSWVNSN
ncbi:hypothetical protein [Polaribacter porphyrae]|uniref:Alpha/beta hydrolase n=1 Tax=Polaribacter porphyrae TaxID=1137780 RepID=A0A2S7WQF7_9FLAO|nr:hypothetical protein [Polaribacter porphyrae]PQJ79823.1 hypothetical protein BTO18_11835 [Polaribacter porphyrae]